MYRRVGVSVGKGGKIGAKRKRYSPEEIARVRGVINPDDKLEIVIERLCELEQKSFGPRHGRTDFYEYLQGVYAVYLDWRAKHKARRNARRVADLYELPVRKKTHPIRVLLDATSDADSRLKSRWAQALQFADLQGVGADGILDLFKRFGGLAGCAREMAAQRKSDEGPIKGVPKKNSLGAKKSSAGYSWYAA
jgi:hypothetical protein